ncbi:MAG: 1,4-dihydroxy-2-naphthoate octaprenyltransferase [Gammaproteobacteria bacterium]
MNKRSSMLAAHSPIDDPSPTLAGPGFAAAARRAFLATRPPFMVAAVTPVLVGTSWAGAAFGRFDGWLFGLALGAMVLAHAAANVYNDVGDDVIGADAGNIDRIYPYTGGSRFIQTGLLSRSQMTRLAVGLAAASLLLGVVLVVLRGPAVIGLGIVGLGLGLLYSLPGVQLSARGLGEATVAIGFGALPVLGSEWLQTGFIDPNAVLLCVPVSAWAAAILIINEVPDIEADRRAGKRTLVVRWGALGARRLYRGLTLITLAASGAAIARHALPLWYGLPALIFAGLGLHAARGISSEPDARPRLKTRIELTLLIHALGCVTLIVAILLRNKF